jgi:hypothetical protein
MNLTLTKTLSGMGEGAVAAIARSGSGGVLVDESIAPGTDTFLNVAFDVSALGLLVILCSRDVTIKTNNAGSPGNTVNLKAGEPYEWYDTSYFTNKFTVDVTAFYYTLAAGANATFLVCAVQDATP